MILRRLIPLVVLASVAFCALPSSAMGMMIYLKTYKGRTISESTQRHTIVEVIEPSDSIDAMKDFIAFREGTPLERQHLVFMGKVLLDGRALSDYNIQDESTIYVYELTAPAAPGGFTGVPSGQATSRAETIGFTLAEPGGTVECQLDSGPWGACTSVSGTTGSMELTGLDLGSHTLSVRQTDSANNIGAVATTAAWEVVSNGLDWGSSPFVRGNLIKSTETDLLVSPVFEWQRCSSLDDASSCSPISGSGADGAWWGTRNADIGQQVRLRTTAGGSEFFTGLSGVVAPSNVAAPFVNQGLVAGAPKRGASIHTSFGTWNGYVAGSSTVSFQWQRSAASDPRAYRTDVGTNSQWYRPVADDVGNYLRVTATLTTNGQVATASSSVTNQVASDLAGRRAHTAVRHKTKRHSR
ncbi:MAG: ubiquitin-like protein [Actinomycetes bacterium]